MKTNQTYPSRCCFRTPRIARITRCAAVLAASTAVISTATFLAPATAGEPCPDRAAALQQRAERKDDRAQRYAERVTSRSLWPSLNCLNPLKWTQEVSRNATIRRETAVEDDLHRQQLVEIERQRMRYELERSRMRDYGPAVLHTKTGIDAEMRLEYGAYRLDLKKAKEMLERQEQAQKKIDLLREKEEARRKQLMQLHATCLGCGCCPCTCQTPPPREPILDEPTRIPLTLPVVMTIQPLRTDYQDVRVVRMPPVPGLPIQQPDCTDRRGEAYPACPLDLPQAPPDRGPAADAPPKRTPPPIPDAKPAPRPDGLPPQPQPRRSDHLDDAQATPAPLPHAEASRLSFREVIEGVLPAGIFARRPAVRFAERVDP